MHACTHTHARMHMHTHTHTRTHTHIPHRVPEVIFEGADVWGNLEDEEAVDVRDTLALFLYSVFLQRLLHSLMEVS